MLSGSEKIEKRRVVETIFRVRYAETDAMGVVHHTSYIVWFEEGRGEYMRRTGTDYAEIERRGFKLPVSEVYVRYISPARYGDLVKVKTWMEKVKSRSVTFGYEVRMVETGKLLATGWTKHICVNEEGRVRRIPQEIREVLADFPLINPL